jgi:flagellar biosynthesis protein FlhF
LKIKRYIVREMQEAIRQIKQDLGSEAVIVSSYKVPAKGITGLFSPRLLEVTAALDESPEMRLSADCLPAQITVEAGSAGSVAERLIGPAKSLPRAFLSGRQADHSFVRSLYPAGGGCKEETPGPGLLSPKWEEELTATAGRPAERATVEDTTNRKGEETRCLFEVMLNKQLQAGLKGESVSGWRKTLLDMDIQESIVEQLLVALHEDEDPPGDRSRHIYLNLFKQVVNLLEPAYRSLESARVLTFVGPSGVGKTTTLAKLATRFSLYDHKKIALVAVCTYRIGVVEQLHAYGEFLGIPVEVVMTPAELASVLESHSDKDYIFIDTAGRSAWNAGQVLELKGFLDVVEEPRDIFLVLSSATKNRDLAKIACEFRKISYSKLIFTKLDETETHGSILNLVCALGTPAAYLTNGQGVPDDIIEAAPTKIAKLLFRGVEPDEIMAN